MDAADAKEMRFLKQLHFTKLEERGDLKKRQAAKQSSTRGSPGRILAQTTSLIGLLRLSRLHKNLCKHFC